MTGGGLIRVSTTVVVILVNGAVPALPRWSPKYPFSATGRTAHRRFATAEIAPVRCAIHSRVASRRQSPPTHACDHGQRVGRSLWRREQGCQPAPRHVDQGWQLRRFSWLVRRWRVPLPLAIVVISCPVVVPPAPPRPMQDAHRAPLYHQPRVARTAVGFRPRSVGPEPAVRFETGQTGLRPPLHPFFWCHVGPRFGPDDRQKRLRPHGQGHVAIPPRPTADLIVIQPDFAFGGLDTFFDRPPHPGHPHQFRQGRCGWGIGDIGRRSVGSAMLRRISTQRCQPPCGGALASNRSQSYQRGPLLPVPALSRSQPSAGRLARRALIRRCCCWSHTDSLPETAST